MDYLILFYSPWICSYNNNPFIYNGKQIKVQLAAVLGDLPELFEFTDVSFGMSCNLCYFTEKEIFQNYGGICLNQRNEIERILLTEYFDWETLHTNCGYLVPLTYVSVLNINYIK